MKVKALAAFRSTLFSPCKKLLVAIRIKLRRPLSIRALRLRPRHKKQRQVPPKNQRSSAFFRVFRPLMVTKKTDRLMDLRSLSEAEHEMLFPSPLTPAAVKANMPVKRAPFPSEEVEDACRSFENYLVEMIVEEGKVRDLMDVEELLFCWKNLKCPVFVDLVCRFYGELCKDLFSAEEDSIQSNRANRS